MANGRRDRTWDAVRGALGAIAGSLGIEIPNATEHVWVRLFEDVDPDELRDAVLLVLDTWKYSRVPPPALIREALEKLREREANDAARAIECRGCNTLGLARTTMQHNGGTVEVMVPCGCALGKGKAIWLNQERRKGRADNQHSFRVPASETAETSYDGVPF